MVMRFPKGKYAAAALLREAQAFVKLNDRIDARLTLQKLVADHAGTPQASAADNMMKDLATD
jgi:TolA-binding protein